MVSPQAEEKTGSFAIHRIEFDVDYRLVRAARMGRSFPFVLSGLMLAVTAAGHIIHPTKLPAGSSASRGFLVDRGGRRGV